MLKPFFNNLLISALSLLLTASWKSSCACLMQSRDVEEEPFNFWLQERKSKEMRSRLLVTILFQNCLFFHSNLCFQKWVNFFLHYCSSGTKSNVASVMFIHFGCCECGVGTTLASNFICNLMRNLLNDECSNWKMYNDVTLSFFVRYVALDPSR